jgi:hypothetical protein
MKPARQWYVLDLFHTTHPHHARKSSRSRPTTNVVVMCAICQLPEKDSMFAGHFKSNIERHIHIHHPEYAIPGITLPARPGLPLPDHFAGRGVSRPAEDSPMDRDRYAHQFGCCGQRTASGSASRNAHCITQATQATSHGASRALNKRIEHRLEPARQTSSPEPGGPCNGTSLNVSG